MWWGDGRTAPALSRQDIARPVTASTLPDRPLYGLALAFAGYAVFSFQDAILKKLVEDFAVVQILFVRSILVMAIMSLVFGAAGWRGLARSTAWKALAGRSALILIAWVSYYSAARELGLAELTTLYFVGPVAVVILSVLFLREHVAPWRWLAVAIGFVGVLIAANPTQSPHLVPAGLALLGAFAWAGTTVLLRLLGRTEATQTTMLASNLVFAAVCGLLLPFVWVTPDIMSLALMLALGLIGATGQYLVFESFRHAPASLLAPTEYAMLIGAFINGYVFFGEIPAAHTYAGAAFIVAGSAILIVMEARGRR